MTERTIIGFCNFHAEGFEREAHLWRSMEQCIGLAFSKLSADDRDNVMTLLRRIDPQSQTETGVEQ